MASQRQIVGSVRTAMHPGDDVFDVMRERTKLLPKQTVFTAITSPVLDKFPRRGTRHSQPFDVSFRCALSFKMAMKSAALISAS